MELVPEQQMMSDIVVYVFTPEITTGEEWAAMRYDICEKLSQRWHFQQITPLKDGSSVSVVIVMVQVA